MKLEDKAEEAPAVHLAGSLTESEYRLRTDELIGADDLTDEGEFPEYGDFLEVDERSPVDGTDRGTVFIEVPGSLARFLVELEMGDWFQILAAEKTSEGTWRFDAERTETNQQESLEAAAAMDGDDGS